MGLPRHVDIRSIHGRRVGIDHYRTIPLPPLSLSLSLSLSSPLLCLSLLACGIFTFSTLTFLRHPSLLDSTKNTILGACGSETLPRGIISSKNLLAIAVGIKQKEIVDQIVTKFFSSDFHVMLFHYDRAVDEWRGFPWCDKAIHVYAVNQTKWWFAKRFLHPDIVSEYSYIFLWDEDLGVENFHPGRYLEIVREEGLEISQPALKTGRGSSVHHSITARQRRNKVHRRFYKLTGGKGCLENSTGPPCTGWVEMMAPVFTSAAWRCAWHMIQNDLIYAWGLDYRLGYCAQGDRTRKIGVVDAEYVVHKGLPTLGGLDPVRFIPFNYHQVGLNGVRLRSYAELEIFKKRWRAAEEEDQCWTDPYPA
ncbi:unnamed protein product [Spirodela intermedia]|uniref:Uncharacterized protein n=1 Tax=Spirodela intermedia TaxID=51605 RepID=A0A7I8JCM3_SPIIN|nr:unnamed protein product [Spirodela intermedia]CAA6667897.1 unnamed protein product [Spirodela intermedia]